MPKVPSMLPQSSGPTREPDPANLLMAAADLHASGELTDPQRSAPMPTVTQSPTAPRTPRKLKVLK